MAFPDGWGRKCSITIDDAFIDADLTNWSLVLTEVVLPAEMLDSNNDNAEQDGGGAIRASSDSAGTTRLPVHVRAFHPTAGGTGAYADLAIKVPAVANAAPTVIYLWWKNPGESQPAANDTYGQHNAYDANYKAVYSLNQDPGPGGANEILDATSNLLHLTAEASMTSADLVAGKVHLGHDYDGIDDYLVRSGVSINPPLTLEALAKFASINDPVACAIALTTPTTEQVALIGNLPHSGPPASPAQMSWSNIYDAGWDVARSTVGLTAGAWYHLAGVLSGTVDIKCYLDGTSEGTGIASGVGFGSDEYTSIGVAVNNDNTPGQFLHGILDEVRISTIARTAPWIKADATNLLSIASLITAGTPSSPAIPAHVIPVGIKTYVGDRKQNSTAYPIVFFMRDETDLKTGELGLSPTVTRSKNGGAWGAALGAVTEVGGGWYSFAGNATDRNTLGDLHLVISATGAATEHLVVAIVVHDPYDMSSTGGGDATLANQVAMQADLDAALANLAAIEGPAFDPNLHALDQTASVTDLWSRPGKVRATPPADTAAIEEHVAWLSHAARHKIRVDKAAGLAVLYNEDGTVAIGQASVTDDGTVYTRDKMQ